MNLDQLSEEYRAAKDAESLARERRYEVERKISELVGTKDEGQITSKTERFKVTAKHKINRTIDAKKWEEIKDGLDPAIALHLIKYKPSLDLKGYRWIRDNDPAAFAIVSKAITSKPAKVGISVEELG